MKIILFYDYQMYKFFLYVKLWQVIPPVDMEGENVQHSGVDKLSCILTDIQNLI